MTGTDIPSEGDLLTFKEAARLVGKVLKRERALDYATLWRYWKRGALTPSRQRIRLKVWKVANVPCTTREALFDFFERRGQATAYPITPTPRQRRVSIKHAERELAKRGI